MGKGKDPTSATEMYAGQEHSGPSPAADAVKGVLILDPSERAAHSVSPPPLGDISISTEATTKRVALKMPTPTAPCVEGEGDDAALHDGMVATDYAAVATDSPTEAPPADEGTTGCTEFGSTECNHPGEEEEKTPAEVHRDEEEKASDCPDDAVTSASVADPESCAENATENEGEGEGEGEGEIDGASRAHSSDSCAGIESLSGPSSSSAVFESRECTATPDISDEATPDFSEDAEDELTDVEDLDDKEETLRTSRDTSEAKLAWRKKWVELQTGDLKRWADSTATSLTRVAANRVAFTHVVDEDNDTEAGTAARTNPVNIVKRRKRVYFYRPAEGLPPARLRGSRKLFGDDHMLFPSYQSKRRRASVGTPSEKNKKHKGLLDDDGTDSAHALPVPKLTISIKVTSTMLSSPAPSTSKSVSKTPRTPNTSKSTSAPTRRRKSCDIIAGPSTPVSTPRSAVQKLLLDASPGTPLGSPLGSPRLGLLKKRKEYGINDVVVPGGIGMATKVELVKAKDIVTPKFKPLLADTLSKLAEGESSDEEDLSDETFAARHAPYQARERRLIVPIIEKQRRDHAPSTPGGVGGGGPHALQCTPPPTTPANTGLLHSVSTNCLEPTTPGALSESRGGPSVGGACLTGGSEGERTSSTVQPPSRQKSKRVLSSCHLPVEELDGVRLVPTTSLCLDAATVVCTTSPDTVNANQLLISPTVVASHKKRRREEIHESCSTQQVTESLASRREGRDVKRPAWLQS